MTSVSIELGTEERATNLFAFPNGSSHNWTWQQTVLHWVNQTIRRDFFDGEISADVEQDGGADNWYLVLSSDNPAVQSALFEYKTRLTQMYEAGWDAYCNVLPKLVEDHRWDPRHKDWRFFMPMGLPVVKTKALNFFHYPPQKMLLDLQDYLNDPVPHRIENLIMASDQGIDDRSEAQLFETIIDGYYS